MRSLPVRNLKQNSFRFEKYRYCFTHLLCIQIFRILLSDSHMWQEHGLREKKCFLVDLFGNWPMIISTLRIQKLKIRELGDFEKIEFEKNAL